MNINDRIHRYLSDAPENRKELTIRHLMTHTSGMRQVEVEVGLNVGKIPLEAHIVPNKCIKIQRQIHLTYFFYPVIPGKGNNVLKFNSFQTTDFGFRDFEIGKPGPVDFR
ncbi:MAG: serine hydrolase [Bacteroidota bacterium]